MSELKTIDFIYFSFHFYFFLVFGLRIRVSMISYITVTYLLHITVIVI